MERRDVIVLGADVEGLAAAAFLARGGQRVTVVDEHEQPGGRWASAEFHPGHAVPGLFHDGHLVRRAALQALELDKHGLAWKPAARALTVVSPEGQRLRIPRGGVGLEPANADAPELARWQAFLDKARPVVDAVLDELPPQAIEPGLGELVRLAKTGLKLRRLGERDMLELVRIPPMSSADWLSEHFTDPLLKAGLAAPALTGTVFGPRAPGTAALLLLQRTADCGAEPVGGAPALVNALVACCTAAGVELRLGQKVRAIRVERGRARGVVVDDDQLLEARAVASALDPQRTLLDLIAPGTLAPATENAVTSWRARGTTAIVRLALSQAPAVAEDAERVLVVASLDQLERAADSLKYDRLPEDPWLDVRFWSASVESSAPAGQGTVSVHVHGIPGRAAWTAKERKGLLAQVRERLELVVPGVGATIAAEELLMPCDLAERYGAPGGHLFHGELALDQLWIQRPSMVLARYATPVAGLYLCGSGSHPGGPFAGAAGVLGARALLAAARD